MLSVDTNLLFYGYLADCAEHAVAIEFLRALAKRIDVVVSEFVLVELYRLLRNPAVVKRPLSAPDAADVVARWRAHPSWRTVGEPEGAPIHGPMWQIASKPSFAARRIFDVRLALSLQAAGVREFATANVRDFAGLGFERVWNPLAEGASAHASGPSHRSA